MRPQRQYPMLWLRAQTYFQRRAAGESVWGAELIKVRKTSLVLGLTWASPPNPQPLGELLSRHTFAGLIIRAYWESTAP